MSWAARVRGLSTPSGPQAQGWRTLSQGNSIDWVRSLVLPSHRSGPMLISALLQLWRPEGEAAVMSRVALAERTRDAQSRMLAAQTAYFYQWVPANAVHGAGVWTGVRMRCCVSGRWRGCVGLGRSLFW